MNRFASALAAGFVFGAGLVLSGMTDPRNIVGFLDVSGNFRPALAAVMLGAIGVHALALRTWRARTDPELLASLPPSKRFDWQLLLGSAVFGVGWGLAGYCPGPAIVAVGAGSGRAAAFVGSLLLGMLAIDALGLKVSGKTRAREQARWSIDDVAEEKYGRSLD